MKPIKIAGISIFFLQLFLAFTLAVKTVDVRPIGPFSSEVGFAALNGFVYALFGGYHPLLYAVTELLGLLPLLTALGFALLGASQLIRRRSFKKVDKDIYVLGGLYVLMLLIYLFFEQCPVNYRPSELGAGLESSYPSSHTLMAICVSASAVMQLRTRIRRAPLRKTAVTFYYTLMLLIAAGRLLSGVHWCTDIIASLMLSGALIFGYSAAVAAHGES